MRPFAQNSTTDALQHLAARGLSEDAAATRPILLRALTDFFVMRPSHSRDEIKQFGEIAHRLIGQAARDEIDHAADALCHHPNAPIDLLDLLASRGGAGALKLLAECRRLSTPCLRNGAAMGPLEAALAIAGRADLDAATIELLSQRPENEILRKLAANESVPLGPDLIPAIILRAHADAELAQILAARLPHRVETLALFLVADTRQRHIMIERTRQRLNAKDVTPAPVGAPSAAMRRIEAIAREGDAAELASALAQACGCEETLARTFIADTGGEPLAIALRAIGLPADMVVRIYLAADPNIERATGRLSAFTKLATGLTPDVAACILNAMTGKRREAGQHMPMQDSQARPSTARPGTARSASNVTHGPLVAAEDTLARQA